MLHVRAAGGGGPGTVKGLVVELILKIRIFFRHVPKKDQSFGLIGNIMF